MPAQTDEPLQPPILVLEGQDVELYPSLAEAIQDLEGVDVADGAYRLFDAAGRRIVLRAEGVKRGRFLVAIGTVHFERIEASAEGVAELRAALIEFLTTTSGRTDLGDADLPALIAALGHTPGRFV